MDSSTTSDLTSAAGIGISAATGNWVGAAIGLVGLGSSIFGSASSAGSASQYSQQANALNSQIYGVQQQEAQTEESVNAQKQQQMVLNNRRQQLENVRNTQRARATNLAAGVSDGAQFGSGLQGGQAAATDQGGVNALGLSQNLMIGNNLFSLDNTLDQQKLAVTGLQSQLGQLTGNYQATQAQNSAYTSIGSSISKSAPLFGNLSTLVGKGGGGGNFSGTPGASNTGGFY